MLWITGYMSNFKILLYKFRIILFVNYLKFSWITNESFYNIYPFIIFICLLFIPSKIPGSPKSLWTSSTHSLNVSNLHWFSIKKYRLFGRTKYIPDTFIFRLRKMMMKKMNGWMHLLVVNCVEKWGIPSICIWISMYYDYKWLFFVWKRLNYIAFYNYYFFDLFFSR